MLNSMGEAYAGQLSRSLGIPSHRVRWMMHGRMPYYSPRLALIPLGLAEETFDGHGRVYAITPKGRRQARSLAKRFRRARIAKADFASGVATSAADKQLWM